MVYRCAQHIMQTIFLSQRISKEKPVEVLSACIIGLTNSLLLVENGYNVQLYAELVPFERSASRPEITTTVEDGYWMPLKVGNID